jgi:tetratricopeptide (TPR) repeat protein
MAAVKWTPLWLGIVFPLAVHADNVTDLMERGRWKEARAAVATMEPGKARTLYLQSRVSQAFDQQDEALASAERAVQLEPNNALYHTQVAEVCGQMAGRAGKLKAFSLARRARKEAEQAVALDPKHVYGREVLANFFWLAPGFVGGDKNKAESMAAEIARISPGQGALVQAEFAMRAKAENRAESLYMRALQSDQTSYTAHLLLARLYASDTRNRWDLTEKHGRDAMAKDPTLRRLQRAHRGVGARPALERARCAAGGGRTPATGDLTPQFQAARTLLAEHRDSLRAERYLRQYLATGAGGRALQLARARGGWDRRWSVKAERWKRSPSSKPLQMDLSFDEAKKDLKRVKKS